MKRITENAMTWRVVSGLIIGLIVAGTLMAMGVPHLTAGSGLLANLFIAFIAAIIAIQLVPGLILFGAMLKGIFSLFRKDKNVEEK